MNSIITVTEHIHRECELDVSRVIALVPRRKELLFESTYWKLNDADFDRVSELWHKLKGGEHSECFTEAQKAAEFIFPELREESDDEKIRKALINGFNKLDKSAVWYNGITNSQILAWLEKQEQKPDDNVDPKFHEGEWITNDDYTWQIVSITDLDYILQSQDGNMVDDTISHVDEQFHSFTIEDAKDGDVLFIGIDGSTCIFKKLEGNLLYSYIISDGKLLVEDSHYYYEASDNVHPATKEQRELLFQKMKEAGYEWDAEKKELKKIIDEKQIKKNLQDNSFRRMFEQKPTDEEMKTLLQNEYEKGRADAIAEMQKSWSEEDELYIRELESLVKQVWATAEHKNDKDTIHKMSDLSFFLKTLKPQLKQEWSDEDENRINRLIAYFEDKESFTAEDDVEYANWLKSIRLQSQWKPSDGQMDSLKGVIDSLPHQQVLFTLYDDLKKLKG